MSNHTTNLIFLEQIDDLHTPCYENSSDVGRCALAHILGIMSAYVFPVYATFGIATNFLTFITFIKWTAKPTRLMIYFACIAIVDNLALLISGWLWLFPSRGVAYASGGTVWFLTYHQAEIWCQVHRYFNALLTCLACSLLTLAVSDRTWSVYYPLQASKIGRRRGWFYVLFIVFICSVMMSPFGIASGYYIDWDGKYTVCWLRRPSTLLTIYYIAFANCGIFQSAVIFILNVMLIWKLKNPTKSMRSVQAKTKMKERIRSGTIVIIILSTIFVLCSLIQGIGYALAAIAHESSTTDIRSLKSALEIIHLGWHMFFIQESISWIVYMQTWPKFFELHKYVFLKSIRTVATRRVFTPRDIQTRTLNTSSFDKLINQLYGSNLTDSMSSISPEHINDYQV